MRNTVPVAGFPSKAEAIRVLTAQGKSPAEIAATIDSTVASVSERLRVMRREAGIPPKRSGRPTVGSDTRGIWTADKLRTAHRLFGKTMLLIAEKLQVPPEELLAYGLKGVIPPMGEGQRVAQLLADLSAEGEAEPLQLAPPEPAQAAVDADNEEQELIELGAAAPEVEPERLAWLPTDPLRSGAAEGNEADLAAPEPSDALTFVEIGDTTVPPYESPACTATLEPSRNDDEAELAALEAEEDTDPVANVGEGANGAIAAASDDPASREVDVAQHQALAVSGFAGAAVDETAAAGGGGVSPAPPAALTAADGAPIYRLKRRGEYVDKSGVGSTRNMRHAWTGTARQIEAIYRRRPEFLEFDAEPVYA